MTDPTIQQDVSQLVTDEAVTAAENLATPAKLPNALWQTALKDVTTLATYKNFAAVIVLGLAYFLAKDGQTVDPALSDTITNNLSQFLALAGALMADIPPLFPTKKA